MGGRCQCTGNRARKIRTPMPGLPAIGCIPRQCTGSCAPGERIECARLVRLLGCRCSACASVPLPSVLLCIFSRARRVSPLFLLLLSVFASFVGNRAHCICYIAATVTPIPPFRRIASASAASSTFRLPLAAFISPDEHTSHFDVLDFDSDSGLLVYL